MIKKIIVVVSLMLLLLSCSQNESPLNETIVIDEDFTMVHLVEMDGITFLSFQYRITNHKKENINPFHVNFVFHDDIMEEYFGVTEYLLLERVRYSLQEGREYREITLTPGETFQGFGSLEAQVDNVDYMKLENAVANHQTFEMQLIDGETDEVFFSQWVQKIAFVDERTE